jgi:hypothetical protein
LLFVAHLSCSFSFSVFIICVFMFTLYLYVFKANCCLLLKLSFMDGNFHVDDCQSNIQTNCVCLAHTLSSDRILDGLTKLFEV